MTVTKRILAGIAELMWPAVGAAVIAILSYGRGNRTVPGRAPLPLWQLLTAYFLTAILSGALYGILKPDRPSKVRLTIAFTAAVLPYTFAVVILSRRGDLFALDRIDIIGALAMALAFGPVLAAYLHIRERDRMNLRGSAET